MSRGSSLAPALLAAALVGCGAERPADLVLITIDTLRADRVGSYGYAPARTPVLDELARGGMRFSGALTTFPRTTPALASLHTGLYPKHHGSREVGQAFETGRTLAERLAANGWVTLGVTGNPAASEPQNLDRGFERFESSRKDPSTERALALARRADPERPLFLWVHYREPHFPYEPPPEHARELAECERVNADVVAGRLSYGALWNNLEGRAERAAPDCSRAYDGEIAWTDAMIGELLAGLRALGRLGHGYVVVTADHGENLGEAGLWYEHGPSLHDASLRIPLVVNGPGVRPGTRAEPVLLEDLAPTLLALVGAEPGAGGFDGTDLSALLAGAAAPAGIAERIAFAESGSALDVDEFAQPFSGRADALHCWNEGRFSLCARPGADPALYDHEADPALRTPLDGAHVEVRARLEEARRHWPAESLRQRAARAGRFKWVETPRLEGGYTSALYDLAADPGETRDVAADHPDVATRLAAAVAGWHAPAAVSARPPDVVEHLRALGYVE